MIVPTTFVPLPPDARVTRRPVFDPALKQFARAFRHGEPAFADPAVRRHWLLVRRQVTAHALRAVAGAGWWGHLVLRGSVLLREWLGDAAREPGDLDFVVTPDTLAMTDPAADALLAGLVTAVRAELPAAGVTPGRPRTDDIWTYDRAPGRRVAFPWHAPGLPAGVLQMDFVFNEPLPEPPVVAEVAGARLRAATPHQSLGWKLRWLADDIWPQAKDLFDAVLLAERFGPPPGRTWFGFDAAGLRVRDWAELAAEHPGVTGDAGLWQARLAAALAG